jgi:hypothetical protein
MTTCKRLLTVLGVTLFALLTGIGETRAQVAVMPPSGDTDMLLLQRFEESLRTVVAERGMTQPSADQVRAAIGVTGSTSNPVDVGRKLGVEVVLVWSANAAGDQVALEVTAVPVSGAASFTTRRVAGRESAMPQAREMARQALRGMTERPLKGSQVAQHGAAASIGDTPVPSRTAPRDGGSSLDPTWTGLALGTNLAMKNHLFPVPASLSLRVIARWVHLGLELCFSASGHVSCRWGWSRSPRT